MHIVSALPSPLASQSEMKLIKASKLKEEVAGNATCSLCANEYELSMADLHIEKNIQSTTSGQPKIVWFCPNCSTVNWDEKQHFEKHRKVIENLDKVARIKEEHAYASSHDR